MAKIIDITDKLNFEDNPKLVIKGVEYEVNSDALSMLKTMQFMNMENPGGKEIMEAYETLFQEKERKKLEKLKLKFDDFVTMIHASVELVIGDGDGSGER